MAKKNMKHAKENQGNQWGDTGPEGNINTLDKGGATDKSSKKPAVTSKHGRDVSIGRAPGKRRAKR